MNYNELMAARKADYEAKMRDIQERENALRLERNKLKADFHSGNRAINETFREMVFTEKGWRKRILNHAHNLHRIFTSILHDQNHGGGYFDKDNTCVQFKIEEDKVVFTIEIPTIKYQKQ